MIENINLDKAQVSAELHGYMYSAVYGKSGVYNYGSKLDYELISNNEIKIKDGLLINSGRFMRIVGNESVAIENGTTGETRYDLIVARFETDGINESHTLKVIKGTSGGGVPDPTQEDVYNGGTIHDLPLYEIKLNGLNIQTITRKFLIIGSVDNLFYRTRTNLFKPTLPTKTSNGVTITNNGDGTFKLNGTATDQVWENLGSAKIYSGKTYRLLGMPTSGFTGTAMVFAEDVASSGNVIDWGEGAPFTSKGDKTANIGIQALAGAKFENCIVKPMITSDIETDLNGFISYEDAVVTGKVLDELKTSITSGGSDYGEVGTWSDGNPSAEDRLYRFVTISGSDRNIAIANSTDQIVGTSNLKENVGFIGNYTAGAESDSSKVIVSILGVSYVKTSDNTIAANDRVMSDDNGYAVKSTNNLGYRVLSVPEEGLLEIVVSPNTDMIQRIKTDMFKYNVGTEEPTTETCPDGYFYFKLSE